MFAREAGSRGGLLSSGLSPRRCLLKTEEHSAASFWITKKKQQSAATGKTLCLCTPVTRTSLMS